MINTASIFTSIVLVVVFTAVLIGGSYGAGLNEQDKSSPKYKAAVAFAGLSAIGIVVIILILIYRALVANDSGKSSVSSRDFDLINFTPEKQPLMARNY